MKHGSTLFLKLAVILIGSPVLALCIFWLPTAVDYLHIPIIIGVYITAIIFFFILFEAFQLLGYIDKNKAFSELSVNVLMRIKYSAVVISMIYTGIIPLLYPIADGDDAPGLMGVPLLFIFAASVVAVFAAVLQRLLQEAIDIKAENDLTV